MSQVLGGLGQPKEPAPLAPFWEALRYGVLGPGKRVRPVLLLETGRMLGAPDNHLLHTAAAMEFVHAQSLIHDDLPCMDDDALRRGRPTVHVAFDEATAVLAGDALIAMAFGHIAETPGVTAATALAVVQDFARVAGVGGLVNGQYADIAYEGGQPFEVTELEYIHANKTAALFGFATRAAARLAETASPELCETLSRFGLLVGLAFQITDDILDCEASAATLGKTAGKDQAKGKATFPAAIGLEASRHRADALLNEALALLSSPPLTANETSRLAQLARFLVCRSH